jgi:ABC-2 type transport system permease protein
MQTLIVFRREMAQYLTSPFAYFIAAGFVLFNSIVFSRDFQSSAEQGIPINPALIPSLISFLLIFFAPLITMRLVAEEKREGMMELYLTAPVSEGAIVVGKYLGAWAYFTLLLAITLVYQLILLAFSPPDIGHTLLAYIGIWLYAGATLSVGLLCSALTENQIVAAFTSMIALLILYIGDFAGQVIGNIEVAAAIRALSLQGHFSTSFQVGLLRLQDIAFFAGIIVITLYLTIRLVEAQRWR